MDRKCRTINKVYKRIASLPTQPNKTYIGSSENEWKKRYYNHRKSFQNQHYQSETMLSSYAWETKCAIDQIPSLKWSSIITVLPAYSNITKRCQRCLYKKYAMIIHPDPENLLNKCSKIMSKCPHQREFLLSNYDTRDWNPDLINSINCSKNWFHQKKLLKALKWKCFWKILLFELNNLLFGQYTVSAVYS